MEERRYTYVGPGIILERNPGVLTYVLIRDILPRGSFYSGCWDFGEGNGRGVGYREWVYENALREGFHKEFD